MKELEIVLKVRDESLRKSVENAVSGFGKAVTSVDKLGAAHDKAASKAEDAARRQKAANDALASARDKTSQKALENAAKEDAASKRSEDRAASFQAKVAAAYQKAADAAAKAAQKAEDADVKASMSRSAAAQKLAAGQVAAAEKAATAQQAASQKILDVEVNRVARLDQLGKQQLSKEEVQLRARAQANQKLQQKRVDDSAKALDGEKKGWFSLEGVVGKTGESILAAGAAYATLATGKAIIFGISEAWAAQRRDVEESVLRITGYQQKLLELADLKDRLGRTTPELGAQLQIRSQTTQSSDDAQKFGEGLLNAGAVAVKGGLIQKDQLDKLAIAGGKAQVTKGIGAETAGNFFGALPSIFGGKDQQAEDITARGLGIIKILQSGSASATSGINQYRAISGLLHSGFNNDPELMGSTLSFFTGMKPDSGGDITQQFVRATTGAIDKTRRGGIEGGEAQGAYLDKLGAKAGMTAPQIGLMIADDLKKQKAATPNFDVSNYLAHHGYGNQDERLAMAFAFNGMENGQFKTFQDMASPDKIPSFGAAMKDIDDSLRVDPTAGARRNAVVKDLADANRSIGAPAMFENAKRQAFERLRGQGKTSGEYDTSNHNNIYQGQILDEVQREIGVRAKKSGIALPDGEGAGDRSGVTYVTDKFFGTGTNAGILGGNPISRMMTSEKTRAEYYADLEKKIGMAGGGGIDNSALIEQLKKSVAATKSLEDAILAGQGKGPAAVNGIPQPPPALNAQPARAVKR